MRAGKLRHCSGEPGLNVRKTCDPYFHSLHQNANTGHDCLRPPQSSSIHAYDLTGYGSMFSTSGVQQHAMSYSQISDSLSRQRSSGPLAVNQAIQAPSGTQTPTLAIIENLLESIVEAISSGDELIIPYRTIRSSQNGANAPSSHVDGRQVDAVRFPGRTAQEVKRFGTVVTGESRVASSSRLRCCNRSPLPHY
jgi:hypothetical protein